MIHDENRGAQPAVAAAAGLGYAMTEMVIEAVSGKGFWAPLRFIASILTRGKDTDPSLSLVPSSSEWPAT